MTKISNHGTTAFLFRRIEIEIEDFVTLRELALSPLLPVHQQVKTLWSALKEAIESKSKSPYCVLCAIQMMIQHGQPGFLAAISDAISRQRMVEALGLDNHAIDIEARMEVARYVKVG